MYVLIIMIQKPKRKSYGHRKSCLVEVRLNKTHLEFTFTEAKLSLSMCGTFNKFLYMATVALRFARKASSTPCFLNTSFSRDVLVRTGYIP